VSEVEELVTYVFRWHTVVDARTCEKCMGLNGKEWQGQDLFQDAIWDEIYAGVWDLNANHSILHPNCRCQLETTVEIHLEKIEVYNFTLGRQVPVGNTARFTILSADIAALRNQMSGFFADLRQGLPVVREMNEGLTMYVALSRKVGLPPYIMDNIRIFEQLRISAQLATRSIIMFLTASGPVGWAIGLGGMFLTAFTLVDQMEMRRPHY